MDLGGVNVDRMRLVTLMKSCRYGIVSSTSDAGLAQSALVGIAVTPQLEIIFDTLKSTRKYANLVARPAYSFVVGWDGEQTVQYEGRAFEPVGSELESYQQAYFAVWPDGPARIAWPGIAYFVVRPAWIRFSDYDHNPPLIEEIRLELSGPWFS
jgi:hypothetical protein